MGRANPEAIRDAEVPTRTVTRVAGVELVEYERLGEEIERHVDHAAPAGERCGDVDVASYVDGEALMMAMRDVAVSSGSACTSAEPEPSHVLRAIGLDEDLARASLRFGLGRFTTAEEIDFTIGAVADAVLRLRMHSAAWRSRGGP